MLITGRVCTRQGRGAWEISPKLFYKNHGKAGASFAKAQIWKVAISRAYSLGSAQDRLLAIPATIHLCTAENVWTAVVKSWPLHPQWDFG